MDRLTGAPIEAELVLGSGHQFLVEPLGHEEQFPAELLA
jgi:hypothetical protein